MDKQEWSVTVEAFGHTRTGRFHARTRDEAEKAALRDAGFHVASKRVLTEEELTAPFRPGASDNI